jgi:ABC-type branched-subunit amino acid transport system substrate-binding protein
MRRLLCALVAGALVLTACGESDASGSAETDAGLKGEPIKIGQIAPTGTSVYNAPDSIAVARAAVLGVNKRGGIGGRPLRLVHCNDEADPNKAAACARKLVSEGVVATVRSVVIAGGAQVSSILQAAGIPDIGRGALVPAEFAASNAYLLDGGVAYPYAAVLQQFAGKGGKRVFFAVMESASADALLATLNGLARRLGLTVAGTQKVAPNTADYTPFVANIGRTGAEAALLAFPQQQIVQTVRAADQSGLKVDWLLNGGGITQADLTALPAAQTARMAVALNSMPLSAAKENEVVARMRADIDAAFKAGDSAANPAKLFGTALTAWAGVNTLPTLLKGKPAIKAATVRAALDQAKDVPLGISVPWTPSRTGPPNFRRVSHPFVYLNTVRNGELTLSRPDPVDVSALLG